MSWHHPLDRTIQGEMPPLRNLRDVEALESIPFAERITVRNTYEALQAGAAVAPDAPAVHFLPNAEPDEAPLTVTFAQLMGRITQTANLLHDLGVGPRDCVSYLLPLVPQVYYTLFGAQAAGIVCAVNPLLEVGQLVDILRAANTKVLVALGPFPGSEIWDKAQAVRAELPGLKAVLQVLGPGDERDGVHPFEPLLERYPADRLVSGRQIAPEDPCSYFHTGGTTGTPKLARHTHANQVYQAWACSMMLGNRPGRPWLTGFPVFHVTGAIGALVQFSCGAPMVQLTAAGFRHPNAVRNFWALNARFGGATVFAVPTVLSALVNLPHEDTDQSAVEFTITGATSVPVEVGRAMEEKLGKAVVEIYGLTEATGLTHAIPRDGGSRLGSTGLRCPYTECRTVKLDGAGGIERDCAPEEIGVVLVKGPHVFSGYVQAQHNTDVVLPGGWLNTGDLGRLDADGYLWITGRAKDTIIRGGHNIDPIVIEEVLYRHPAVAVAAAVGQPDGYAGELPVVYVQPQPDAKASEAELLAFVKERIPERAATPVSLYFVDPMPTTLVGKVYRPALRWDAVRRVFDDALAGLAELRAGGVSCAVDVAAHETHGTLATVRLSAPPEADRAAVAAQVAERLAPFAVRHEVVWE